MVPCLILFSCEFSVTLRMLESDKTTNHSYYRSLGLFLTLHLFPLLIVLSRQASKKLSLRAEYGGGVSVLTFEPSIQQPVNVQRDNTICLQALSLCSMCFYQLLCSLAVFTHSNNKWRLSGTLRLNQQFSFGLIHPPPSQHTTHTRQKISFFFIYFFFLLCNCLVFNSTQPIKPRLELQPDFREGRSFGTFGQ